MLNAEVIGNSDFAPQFSIQHSAFRFLLTTSSCPTAAATDRSADAGGRPVQDGGPYGCSRAPWRRESYTPRAAGTRSAATRATRAVPDSRQSGRRDRARRETGGEVPARTPARPLANRVPRSSPSGHGCHRIDRRTMSPRTSCARRSRQSSDSRRERDARRPETSAPPTSSPVRDASNVSISSSRVSMSGWMVHERARRRLAAQGII